MESLDMETQMIEAIVPMRWVKICLKCAISILNTVKCWGYNFYGQLGYEDTNNRGDSANEMGNHLPEVYLGTDFHVAQIVVGAYHTCAISVLNTVKCWGYGDTHNR
eukprot:364571_1